MRDRLNTVMLVVIAAMMASVFAKTYFPDTVARIAASTKPAPQVTKIAEANSADALATAPEFGKAIGAQLGEAMGQAVSSAFSGGFVEPAVAAEIQAMQIAPDADEAAVKKYLDRLAELSKSNGAHSSADPQVEAIRKLGSTRITQILDYTAGPLKFYIPYALSEWKDDAVKSAVLLRLKKDQELIDLVVDNGWAAGAADTIKAELPFVKGFETKKWIRAAVQTGDKAIYPLLADKLAHVDELLQMEFNEIYTTLIAAPGLPLATLHEQWWAHAGKPTLSSMNELTMAILCTKQGVMPALKSIAMTWQERDSPNRNLSDQELPKFREQLRIALDALVQGCANTEDRVQLVLAPASKLVFDKDSNAYAPAP